MLEYRAQIIVWVLAGINPILMMMIWMELAKESSLGGYSRTDFASYFLTAFFVRQMTIVWVVYDLDREIRLGDLSPKLLKPVDPFWEHAIVNLAEKVIRLPIILIPIAIGFWVTGAKIALTPVAILSFLLALTIAWLLRFHENYNYGLISFWTQSSVGIHQLMWTIYFIFSGVAIPIDLLPKTISKITYLTPFPYMLDFPVRILLGKTSPQETMQGFIIAFAWVLLLVVIRYQLWKSGIKRYGAVGA